MIATTEVNVWSGTPEWRAWANACADEAEHTLDCSGCEISAITLRRCVEGKRLHEVQMAAWSAWRRAREGGQR